MSKSVSSVFAERLHEIRGDMNQNEFSELTGISRASISNYENGHRTPDITALRQLHEATGISVNYMLGISDTKHDAHVCVDTYRALIEEYACIIQELKRMLDMYKGASNYTDICMASMDKKLAQLIEKEKDA